MLEILEKLVSINSVLGNEEEIAIWIKQYLEKNNYEVEMQRVENNRYNIFAKRGNPSLCFFGHMDTVGIAKGWTKDPFKLTIEGDRAYGLGTWDMKGGLSTILNIAKEKDIKICFSCDEEGISKGSFKAIEEKKEFFEDIEGIVSAEAGNDENSFGGINNISIGRYGRKRYHVRKSFKGGHAATSQQEWIDWLYNFKNKYEGESKVVINNLRTKTIDFSVVSEIEFDIDVIESPNEKIRFDEGEFDTLELAKRETPYLESFLSKKGKLLENARRIVKEITGEDPSIRIGKSVGDENNLAKLGKEIIIVGPEGRNEHRADEWVSLKSLKELSLLYSSLIDSF